MPQSCTHCNRVLKSDNKFLLCSGCLTQLRFLKKGDMGNLSVNEYINDEKIAFDYEVAVCSYDGIAKNMVHSLKYKDKQNIAYTIAALIHDEIKRYNEGYDIIIPVPIHKNRMKSRGYNQVELIARELSYLMGIPYKIYLNRIKNTQSQVLFNGIDRWYNVEGAFSCHCNLSNKRVLLIDDVITTGATVHFCSLELKKSGAAKVTVAAFAKT